MSEHQPPPAEPGQPASTSTTADPDTTARPDATASTDADEAELIRKVVRTQERHREGGIDPELDTGDRAEHHGE